jgi:aryl-alcohol dehydrogenase-like predicted oxidoreductase
MDYRSLGCTGMQVSPLCLGAMMFGAWGEPDHQTSIGIIHRASGGWAPTGSPLPGAPPDPDTDVDETLSALTDLQRQGKIRAFGSSTFPAEQIVEAQWTAQQRALGRFVTEQPPYSLLVRGVEADELPVAQRYGMGVLPWSPLAGGRLTGKYRKGQDAPTPWPCLPNRLRSP